MPADCDRGVASKKGVLVWVWLQGEQWLEDEEMVRQRLGQERLAPVPDYPPRPAFGHRGQRDPYAFPVFGTYARHYTEVCARTCVYVYVYVCVCVCVRVCARAHARARTHARERAPTCMLGQMHVWTARKARGR